MNGDAYVVAVQSSAIDSLGEITPAIARNISRAINRTIDRGRTASERGIREQVNYPGGYLAPAQGRLTVSKRSTPEDPVAIITGRARPTSLARFGRGVKRAGVPGVSVTVNPGSTQFLPRAFFVPLRSGSDGLGNLGLAIRLQEGQTPSRAYKPKLVGRNLWLLYGPSVQQVFDDVAGDIEPDTADFLEQEFLRLMELDLR